MVIINEISLIIDFLGKNYNFNDIDVELRTLIYKLGYTSKVEPLSEWNLKLSATYNIGKVPLVTKNKLGNRKSDKIKEISIIIPIPNIKECIWGCKSDQFIYEENHYEKIKNNFFVLNTKAVDFKDRQTYILACMQEGIKRVFNEGFTVGKIKVKEQG